MCFRHPKLLHVVHGAEETSETLAFASEPLIGSLANILNNGSGGSLDHGEKSNHTNNSNNSLLKIDYNFIDVEYRYGFSQITDALTFLHVSCRYVHRNVCPNSVFVTRSGSWKLGGLEFIEKMGDVENSEIPCTPWTTRMPKYAQPNLN